MSVAVGRGLRPLDDRTCLPAYFGPTNLTPLEAHAWLSGRLHQSAGISGADGAGHPAAMIWNPAPLEQFQKASARLFAEIVGVDNSEHLG
jgi:hypothetical protein